MLKIKALVVYCFQQYLVFLLSLYNIWLSISSNLDKKNPLQTIQINLKENHTLPKEGTKSQPHVRIEGLVRISCEWTVSRDYK